MTTTEYAEGDPVLMPNTETINKVIAMERGREKMTIDYQLPTNGSTWVVVFLDTKKRLTKALSWAHNRRRSWLARTIDNGFEIVIESPGNEDIHNEIYGWSKGDTGE